MKIVLYSAEYRDKIDVGKLLVKVSGDVLIYAQANLPYQRKLVQCSTLCCTQTHTSPSSKKTE